MTDSHWRAKGEILWSTLSCLILMQHRVFLSSQSFYNEINWISTDTVDCPLRLMVALIYGQPRKVFVMKDFMEVKMVLFNYGIQWQPRFVLPEAMLIGKRIKESGSLMSITVLWAERERERKSSSRSL